MRSEMAGVLEEFVRAGDLGDPVQLDALVADLRREATDSSDLVAGKLAEALSVLSAHGGKGPVPHRVAAEIDGIVFPRLWKLLEAVWDHLGEAEMTTRVGSLDRRLNQVLTVGTASPGKKVRR